MPTNETLRKFLRENRIDYAVTQHPLAFTAQKVAQSLRVTGYELAKVVALEGSGRHVMAVLPAPLLVDVEKLRELTGIPDLALSSEETFEGLFPDSEKGAMHPFGNLYDMPVWVDATLSARGEIVFNACTHRETITMPYDAYERIAKPRVASFAMKAAEAPAGRHRA